MNNNQTVINARINEIATSWTTVGIILMVNIPQIIAGIVILGKYWGKDHTCDELHMRRWSWWALLSIVRMIAYSIVIFYIQVFRASLQTQNERYMKIVSLRNTIEAFALIWFVVGNMWLFGDDDNSCHHPQSSHIYNLCLTYIILMYLQICAPCIIAILLIPVFCLCLPCFIRILARLHDPRRTQVCMLQRLYQRVSCTHICCLLEIGSTTICHRHITRDHNQSRSHLSNINVSHLSQ